MALSKAQSLEDPSARTNALSIVRASNITIAHASGKRFKKCIDGESTHMHERERGSHLAMWSCPQLLRPGGAFVCRGAMCTLTTFKTCVSILAKVPLVY